MFQEGGSKRRAGGRRVGENDDEPVERLSLDDRGDRQATVGLADVEIRGAGWAVGGSNEGLRDGSTEEERGRREGGDDQLAGGDGRSSKERFGDAPLNADGDESSESKEGDHFGLGKEEGGKRRVSRGRRERRERRALRQNLTMRIGCMERCRKQASRK